MLRAISTPRAPAPLGHYEQAIACGELVFVSGQLAIDPETGEARTGSIEEQTRLALENIRMILEAAGSNKDRVLKTTVYISDIGLWGRMNEAYAQFFGSHRPARAAVPTRDLPKGLLVEIDAIAGLE